MASGKQTPRQKMINLMYLVFIAMMALQMSREVLTAFGMVNESLTETNERTTERNNALLASLNTKAQDQPAKFQPLYERAQQVDAVSSDLNTTLQDLKTRLQSSVDDPTDYEAQDKPDALDEYFFQSGKPSAAGQEFMTQINEYRESIISLVGEQYPDIAAQVREKFSTEPVEDSEGVTKNWLNYHFEGYPMVASMTKFTQMQNDVKSVESEILGRLLSGQLESEVSLTNYSAIVIPDKTAFFSGENFTGRIMLGRVDESLQFENVIINGREVETTSAGQVQLDFPAGNVGEQEITGELQFQEGDSLVRIPVRSSYAVIPKPNSAVISADKMNVVYRGVANPMTVSIPGVGNVSANAPGLRSAGGAGNYILDVTTLQAREVTITASGQLPGGETVSDSKTFRVKDIPRPVGTVRGEDGTVRMQRDNLAISTIGASLPDFDFEVDLRVTGFKISVPGQPSIQVRGQQLDAAAKAALGRAARGSTIQIFDIEAQLAGGTNYRLKSVSPVVVELTN